MSALTDRGTTGTTGTGRATASSSKELAGKVETTALEETTATRPSPTAVVGLVAAAIAVAERLGEGPVGTAVGT